jgi:ribosomal protein S18 acetylase RimI-like enzyme
MKELNHLSSSIDKSKFIKSYLSIWNDHENIKYLSYTGFYFKEEQIKNWVESLSEKSEIAYYDYEEENRILGIAVIRKSEIEGYELLGLGIEPNSKKRGIGNRIIEYCCNMAKESEYKSIALTVFSDNVSMLRLVLKKGFIPIEIRNGQRYDGMSTLRLLKKL